MGQAFAGKGHVRAGGALIHGKRTYICIVSPQMQGTGKAKQAKQAKQAKKKKHIIMYVHSVQFCMCKMQLFSGIDDIRDRSFLILKTIRTPREGYKAIICINNRRSGKRPDWRWMEII